MNSRVLILILQAVLIILAPIWTLKVCHYFVIPLPFFFSSPSLIPTEELSIKDWSKVSLITTFANAILFSLFFFQHYLMATLRFKIFFSKIWSVFPAFQRIFYNLISSVLIIIVLEYQQPQNYILFQLPIYFTLMLAIGGAVLFIEANLRMKQSLLLPYEISKLFIQKQIKFKENTYQQIEKGGITLQGSYKFVRHPMQSGFLLLCIFGSNVFTIQKVIMTGLMVVSVLVGVAMEQTRLLRKYEQYREYSKSVKARFIPFLI